MKHCTLPPHSPLLSDPVDVDNVVCLANGDFGGVRGERHAFHHVALPAVLWAEDRLSPRGRPPRPTHTAHSHGQQPGPRTLTLASAGLVENLSRRSPCSSYSSTTRSAVHTAKRPLLADQAMQVTRAVPSCGTHTQPQRPDSPRFPPAPPDPKRPDSTRPAGTAGSSRAAAASCGTESGSSTRSHRRRTPLQPTPVA